MFRLPSSRTCASAFALLVLITASLLYYSSPGGRGKGRFAHKHHGPSFKAPLNETFVPVVDNFPLAAAATSADQLPPVPFWNRPPAKHVDEVTPLFIGFTRNWLLLQQAVVSYIAAGWPPSDIYVVDNTGTMLSNSLNHLTLQNPFYLDHHRLTHIFGVNVLTTPTLLSFAQLQNFYLYTALANNWPQYFWSHMDVVALAAEANRDINPYASFYMRAVAVLRRVVSGEKSWGAVFFAYDQLTLISTAAYAAIGGWDTFIPYYKTDCDCNYRVSQQTHPIENTQVGLIFDVGDSLPDLRALYREDSAAARESCTPEDIAAAADTTTAPSNNADDNIAYARADCRFHALKRSIEGLYHRKNSHKGGRNYWQTLQKGGQGEPFFHNQAGFEKALQMHMENGRRVYEEKWGHRDCDLKDAGLRPQDAWRVEHDWDRT